MALVGTYADAGFSLEGNTNLSENNDARAVLGGSTIVGAISSEASNPIEFHVFVSLLLKDGGDCD